MDLVKPITSDHDLIELAEKIGVHLDDIFESSEITQPLPKKGSFLILMRQPNMDVGHWVCVYDGEYFDSMGEAAPTKRLGLIGTTQSSFKVRMVITVVPSVCYGYIASSTKYLMYLRTCKI
ncbi:unnamed protein product [Phytophthora lilii]|uniref:Unnamed protein product n=1 Tax=Phytophthora lilii TaxID=2077276 RepID=A0A9W6WSZ3_9STRA|nr:unnamed protein product [Phytophthora lilii]